MTLLLSKQTPHVLEEHEEVQRVCGRGDKVESFVKPSRFLILGMHDDCPNPGNIGGLQCSQHGIFQQAGADALPLPMTIYGESRQKHDGDRVLREAFLHSLWCRITDDLPIRKRVVAHDRFTTQPYVGLRSPGLLTGPGVALEKTVQFFVTTVEGINDVVTPKLFDTTISVLWWCQRTQVLSRDAACAGVDAVGHRGR